MPRKHSGSLSFLPLLCLSLNFATSLPWITDSGLSFIYVLNTYMVLHKSLVTYQLTQNLPAQECAVTTPRLTYFHTSWHAGGGGQKDIAAFTPHGQLGQLTPWEQGELPFPLFAPRGVPEPCHLLSLVSTMGFPFPVSSFLSVVGQGGHSATPWFLLWHHT